MTSPGSNLDLDITGFAARFIEVSETAARARVIAQTVVDSFPSSYCHRLPLPRKTTTAVVLDPPQAAQVGDGAEPDPQNTRLRDRDHGIPWSDDLKAVIVLEGRHPGSRGIRPSQQCSPNTVKCMAYLPLLTDRGLIGAVEIVEFRYQLCPSRSLEGLEPMCEVAGPVAGIVAAYEDRTAHLAYLNYSSHPVL